MFLLSPYLLYSYFTSLTFKHAINPCEAQGQIGTEEHCNCFDCASLSEIEGWILLPSWEGCRGGFLFQSTLPRGERRQCYKLTVLQVLFQSTLPRGERRRRKGRNCPSQRVSIHAPARGATDRFCGLYRCFYVSIHAPARGATMREGGRCP